MIEWQEQKFDYLNPYLNSASESSIDETSYSVNRD